MNILNTNSIFKEDNSNDIFDYDRNGGFDAQGQPKQLYGDDAVQNALELWMLSYKGETLRDPLAGGYVSFYLQKPINEDTARALDEAIRVGIEQDFNPPLTITNLVVQPDYTNNAWFIQLSVESRDLKIQTTLATSLPVKV